MLSDNDFWRYSLAETKGGVVQIDLLEGKGFLLADDGKNVQDKKIEPAVPDEKEDDGQDDKENKKEDKVHKKANPGLYTYICSNKCS